MIIVIIYNTTHHSSFDHPPQLLFGCVQQCLCVGECLVCVPSFFVQGGVCG